MDGLAGNLIEIDGLEVSYRRRAAPALLIDHLRIARGERVAVIGQSGSGKSTLLRAIKAYVRPQRGSVRVMGVDLWSVPRHRRREVNRQVGLIYQLFHLAPRLTVLRNVLCGRLGMTSTWRSLLGWFSQEDIAAAWSAIREVGLRDQLHQRASTLSGGEQQRVAVSRVLAQQPTIVLADEPVSSLDPAWAENVLELLASVHSQHAVTLVMSLHQPHFARQFADRIIGLHKGRVVIDGRSADLSDASLEELYRGDDVAGALRRADAKRTTVVAAATA